MKYVEIPQQSELFKFKVVALKRLTLKEGFKICWHFPFRMVEVLILSEGEKKKSLPKASVF